MPFNSIVFWAFFGCVFALYRLLPHKLQNRMLLVASYIFYGYWDWRFLSLIFASTVVDFYLARRIASSDSQHDRKVSVVLSAVVNLGLLGVFKYYGFFAKEMNALLTGLGAGAPVPLIELILPVGISFYTFQTMSYTIDVYRSETEHTDDFLDFALYVSFFPQLVAGPIERSFRLLPQITNPRVTSANAFDEGLHHVVVGLFKKVVIADNLAVVVNSVFGRDPSSLTGPECVVGLYAFAFQIYGDFSGYSSIAIGVSKWMGFDLMTNFRTPYFAVSPSDFWRRWHISLSTWLRDYLYIGLGGNRGGAGRTYRNLFLTMLLGGIWHGANWTFVAWGAFHGLLLCVFRIFDRKRLSGVDVSPSSWLRRVMMFHLVCIGWLLFRAETLTQAFTMLKLMITSFSMTPFALSGLGLIGFYAGPFLLYELWSHLRSDNEFLFREHWLKKGIAYSYCVLMIWFFPPTAAHEFIYFQF